MSPKRPAPEDEENIFLEENVPTITTVTTTEETTDEAPTIATAEETTIAAALATEVEPATITTAEGGGEGEALSEETTTKAHEGEGPTGEEVTGEGNDEEEAATTEIKKDDDVVKKPKAKKIKTEGGKKEKKKKPAISRRVTCRGGILGQLSKDTIDLVNQLVPNMTTDDDIAIIVQFTNKSNLHRALALNDAPVPQSADPLSSLRAYKEWMIKQAHEIHPNCRIMNFQSETVLGFHEITIEESIDIIYDKWYQAVWNYYLHENRRGSHPDRIGEFYHIYLLEGISAKKASLSAAQKYIPPK